MNDTLSSPRRARLAPHLALIAVQIMFATWPIIGKIALRAIPSTGLVALRVAGAALAFSLLQRTQKSTPFRSKSDYVRLALYSLLGVVLNQFLFVKGLDLSTVVNATVLGTAIPVFTLVVSIVLGYERASLRKALGIALATSGVIYLVNPLRADFSAQTTLGNLLLVANAFAYGAYIAVSQDTLRRYGALTVITWIFLFGCVVTVPVGGFYLTQTPLENLGIEVWLAVLYIILVPTVGAYYLNAWALARVAPSTVAGYIYLQPLIAFTLAPLILNERWGLRTGVAALMIFAGVAVITWWRAAPSRATEEISEHPEAFGH
jgi:drug/metabolite transporter (DMT)-like permease